MSDEPPPRTDRLFRDEALEASLERHLGAGLTAQPLAFRLITLSALAAVTVLIGFAALAHYAHREHVVGFLAPDKGLIRISSAQVGVVESIRVIEGQRVRRGDALVTLNFEHRTGSGTDGQSRAMALLDRRRATLDAEIGQQQQVDAIQLRAMKAHAADLERESGQLQAAIRTQTERVANAAAMVERYQTLVRSDFVSGSLLHQQQDLWLEQRTKLEELQLAWSKAETELNALRHQIESVPAADAIRRSALARGKDEINQQLTEHEMQRDLLITAPVDGTVTAILAGIGQPTRANAVLMSLLPDGARLRAEVFVPSRAAGFVAPGQAVTIRYPAFPYQRFGVHSGRIAEVSRAILAPADLDLPITLQEPVYRVIVALDQPTVMAYGKAWPLQPGMVLDADIELGRQSLLSWVLDPLYSLTGRL